MKVTFPPDWYVLARLGKFVMWLSFALFHLALAVAALFLLWCYQVQPRQVYDWLVAIRESWPARWLGALGVGGLAILFLYIRAWRAIFSRVTTAYFFRELNLD
ncbi:MAG TPA: hypothetical protein VKY65_17985 [Alphaproteobacteria bacterium]|nr:hypothetical protein [Alphaproteobacteria bacterium]